MKIYTDKLFFIHSLTINKRGELFTSISVRLGTLSCEPATNITSGEPQQKWHAPKDLHLDHLELSPGAQAPQHLDEDLPRSSLGI